MMDDEEMFLLYDYEVDSPAASAHVSTHSCPAARTIRTGDLVKEDWSRRVSIPLTVTRPTTGVNMGRRTSSKHQKRAEMVKELLETGESDGEESPSERKKVMIGPNHQAVVPERADNRDQAVIVRERQCESLLWDPSVLPETTVASFLLHAQSRGGDDTYRVRDDEEALWHLMRAHFDSREALKRMSFAVKKDDCAHTVRRRVCVLLLPVEEGNQQCPAPLHHPRPWPPPPPPAACPTPERPPSLGLSETDPGPCSAPPRDPDGTGAQAVWWGGGPFKQGCELRGSYDLHSVFK